MKNNIIKRAVSLLLALVCVMGILPLSAFAAEGLSQAPSTITQKSSDYMKIGGKSVRYEAASSVINNIGLPYVFDEQVEVPGYGSTRALCAYQKGTLGPAANGQKWNFKEEVNSSSLKVLLTYIYAHTYGNFTDTGSALGLEHWGQYWSDIWFMVAQAMSWYYEHGIILDVNSNREGFIEQCAEEFVAAMKLYHRKYGQSSTARMAVLLATPPMTTLPLASILCWTTRNITPSITCGSTSGTRASPGSWRASPACPCSTC